MSENVFKENVFKLGVVKLGCIGAAPLLDLILDERADREDLPYALIPAALSLIRIPARARLKMSFIINPIWCYW